MIKFVHSADIHLGTVFAGVGPRAADALKKGLARAFGELIDYCIDNEADLLLLSGDIFDAAVPSPADAELFRREVGRLRGTRVFAALGNHDYGAAEAMGREGVHVFSPSPEKIYLPELNANICGRSFAGQFCPESMLDGLAAEEGKINILCMHGNLRGQVSNPITPKQLEEGGFNYAALGHVHSFFRERFGNTTVCYSGCLAGRGFDETGERGFVAGRIGKTVETEFIPSSAPRFEEIRIFADDYADDGETLRSIESRLKTDGLYRVIVSGGNLPESYIASRLEGKALFVEVRREEEAMPDSPFLKILKEELRDNPKALDIALKALTGRGDEI